MKEATFENLKEANLKEQRVTWIEAVVLSCDFWSRRSRNVEGNSEGRLALRQRQENSLVIGPFLLTVVCLVSLHSFNPPLSMMISWLNSTQPN